jgi:hypothetical protein
VRTAKNGIAEGFYPGMGFSPLHSDADRSSWLLPLPAGAETLPAWIRLHIEGEGH